MDVITGAKHGMLDEYGFYVTQHVRHTWRLRLARRRTSGRETRGSRLKARVRKHRKPKPHVDSSIDRLISRECAPYRRARLRHASRLSGAARQILPWGAVFPSCSALLP